MSEKKQLYDRRSVLRATAGTAAALSAVGVASAAEFGPGDCVVVDESAASRPQCDALISSPVDGGTTGKVKQSCNSVDDRYYVDWDDDSAEDGWVNGSSLDPC